MKTLFPIEFESSPPPQIPGLLYIADYVTPESEQSLVAAIDAEPWDTTWERRRQPYGGGYGREDKTVPEIPNWGRVLADRMFHEGICEQPFDHMLVNEYLAGQGIAMHRDYEPFDRTVVSLSLLSPCVMDFRNIKDGRQESMLLQPRSLLVLSDEARYEWQHGIARRKKDRWNGQTIPRSRRLSVTFRRHKRTEVGR
jgi:alkylated DNA repair dioxygenase AlkB